MFKVIEDPEQLRALGAAGLLWYLRPTRVWKPSQNTPHHWKVMNTHVLRSLCTHRVYAVLLED